MSQTDQTFARLNTDDSSESRPTSDFTAGQNLALEPGAVQPQRGNVLVPYALPTTGTNKRLGGFEDGATGAAVSLLYNSLGAHRLIRYDPALGTETTLLEWSGLNLSAYLVLQGGILDGALVYLDADGAARNVNLKRATNGQYTAALLLADPYALHLVKRPPNTTPTVARVTVPATTPESTFRIIQDKAFQFTTRWRYIDGETTVFGPYSEWLDVREDPSITVFNAIRINITEPSPLVAEVDILVRQAGLSAFQVAKTLRRTAGVLPLSADFFGAVSGQTPSAAEQARLFEAAWPAKAMVVAQSRVMITNTKEGFVVPLPAFSAVAQVGDVTSVVPVTLYLVSIRYSGIGRNDDAYPYYAYTLIAGPGALPYPNTGSTYRPVDVILDSMGNISGYRLNTASADVSYTGAFITPHWVQEVSRTVAVLPNVSFLANEGNGSTFLGRSTVPVSVQFYNAQGQFPGAAPAVSVFIPAPTVGNKYQRIRWALPTVDAAALNAEIPAWAEYYQIVMGRNTRAAFFLQGETDNVQSYYGTTTTVNATTGVTVTAPQLGPMADLHQRLWVNIANWATNGRGYVWAAGSGDVLRFIGEEVDCQITDQRGNYLEVSWTGHPVSTQTLIEVYAPAISSDSALYEVGPRYAVTRQITAAGDEQRGYSNAGGLLSGDCFIEDIPTASSTRTASATVTIPKYRQRRTAIVATPSASGARNVSMEGRVGSGSGDVFLPSITVSTVVNTSMSDPGASAWLDAAQRGRPTQVTPLSLQQVLRPTVVRFSGRKVAGTLLNGLSQWDALSQYEDVPQEQGAITRLTVADQTQTDGSILLVNQERGNMSLSLGQSQIRTADNQPLLAISSSVIGGGNALRGGYGCTDPAGVVAYAGKVFFPSRTRAELLRYDRNGLTPLGLTYKARTRLEAAFRLYAAARITGCFDPNRKEYLLTFHATATLPDLTLVYSDRREAWSDQITCSPEAGLAVGNELVTWLNGQLWRHTADAPVATFFGLLSPVTLTFITSQPGGRLTKIWRRLAVNSHGRWLPTSLTNLDGQASRILSSWFKYSGGIWRAAVRRDENTPGQLSPTISLHEGSVLQSAALEVTLTADPGSAQPLTAASVEFMLAAGQGHSS